MSASIYLNRLQSSKASLIGLSLASLVLISAGVLIWYYQFCQTHVPLNTTINTIAVSGLRYEEAKALLQNSLPTPPQHQLNLSVDDISVASSSAELDAHYDFNDPLTRVQMQTSTGSLRAQLRTMLGGLWGTTERQAPLHYDIQKLESYISSLNTLVAYPGATPSATLKQSNNPETLVIDPGKYGREINQPETKARILAEVRMGETNVSAVVSSTSGMLSEEEIARAKARAANLVGETIEFTFENVTFTLSDQDLIAVLRLPTGVDSEKTRAIATKWSTNLNRSPQEPEFIYDKATLKVTTFKPPQNGRALDIAATEEQILSAIAAAESKTSLSEALDVETAVASSAAQSAPAGNAAAANSVPDNISHTLSVVTTPPQTSLAETNDLGIKERIGFGDSHYDHSIPNRVHNVALTTGRVNLIIVPPGKEFRFNEALGPVSAETGFKSAYVIRNGQTELGDGGGVCQVSTTIFRSVLNAGLDVTLRLPHSYRVSYYELDQKPGVDATVYAGNTDFRFINDSGHHILLSGAADSENLYMYYEIYGTSDGRTAEIIDHKTWNYRPPLPPQYIDDPSLAPGQVKQVDWAAAGISASFTNVVKDKNGQIIHNDTYVSNYRPWAAKYLRGV